MQQLASTDSDERSVVIRLRDCNNRHRLMMTGKVTDLAVVAVQRLRRRRGLAVRTGQVGRQDHLARLRLAVPVVKLGMVKTTVPKSHNPCHTSENRNQQSDLRRHASDS